MTTVSDSVSEVILASRARLNSLTESLSQVRRATFLTDVGGPLLSESCLDPNVQLGGSIELG